MNDTKTRPPPGGAELTSRLEYAVGESRRLREERKDIVNALNRSLERFDVSLREYRLFQE